MKIKCFIKYVKIHSITFTIVTYISCVYIPPYIQIGNATCSNPDKAHVYSYFSDDSSNQIKGFYSYSDLDSIILRNKNEGIKIIRFYKGVINGAHEVWYRNGMLHQRIIYDNGIEVFRTRQQFDSFGRSADKWTDSLNGYTFYECWFPSKKIEMQIRYKNGLIDGDLLLFRDDGSLAAKAFYMYGKSDPTKTFLYDLNGRDIMQPTMNLISSQGHIFSNIYGYYLYKNPNLRGTVRLFLFFNATEGKMISIILSSTINCTEFLENVNKVIMHIQFDPLIFKGNNNIDFIKEYKFVGDK
jgi:hypothetical protein